MTDNPDAPGASPLLPAWIAAVEEQRRLQRETPWDASPPGEATTLLDWLKTAPEAADLLPEARLSMGHRIITNLGEHALPAQWAAYLEAPREKEQHLFRRGPYSAELEIEKLRKMTAAQRHSKSNERGGRK